MRLSPAMLARFEGSSEATECILWSGPTDRDGYGLATVLDPKRTRGAHRVALALAKGVDVDTFRGWLILHSCDTPQCITVAHLRRGTQKENMADKIERGRNSVRTECRQGHPLTDENVYVDKRTGKRRCAICHRRRQAEYDKRESNQ